MTTTKSQHIRPIQYRLGRETLVLLRCTGLTSPPKGVQCTVLVVADPQDPISLAELSKNLVEENRIFVLASRGCTDAALALKYAHVMGTRCKGLVLLDLSSSCLDTYSHDSSALKSCTDKVLPAMLSLPLLVRGDAGLIKRCFDIKSAAMRIEIQPDARSTRCCLLAKCKQPLLNLCRCAMGWAPEEDESEHAAHNENDTLIMPSDQSRHGDEDPRLYIPPGFLSDCFFESR